MATIGIIVPVYKVEPYLRRCVDSILNQSFSDFQLVLVDDGSPDRCGAICDDYAKKDSRIHVIHQENGGLSAARNAGLDWVFANADVSWLAFIDSDDWIHVDYLKILLDAAQTNGADIAQCGLQRTEALCPDMELGEIPLVVLSPEQAYADFYGMCMTACCKVCRRVLYENLRFPLRKLHEDAYVTHILTFAAVKIAVCDTPLYYYFANQQSITRARWTPKRLVQLEAHEQRLDYFREKGYPEAYRRELEVYGDTLLEQATALLELCREDKSVRPYLSQIRRKLRWTLGQEKKVGGLNFDQGRLWFYLAAYPTGPLFALAKSAQKMKNSRS